MRWGYSDGSVRFYAVTSRDSHGGGQGSGGASASGGGSGSGGGKKLLALYENLHLGAPTTATFADSRTLVTAGADAVVAIWNVVPAASAGKPVELVHRAALFGHRASVAILAASKSLATLLSADTSGRVLLWDLNGGEFVRELRPGDGSSGGSGVNCVRAARISSATGEIVVAVGRTVELYTLNGDRLLRHSVADERDPGDYVSCVAWYEGLRGEWVEKILLLTGHRSGVTKVCFLLP
jgi:WD40 repeat protein